MLAALPHDLDIGMAPVPQLEPAARKIKLSVAANKLDGRITVFVIHRGKWGRSFAEGFAIQDGQNADATDEDFEIF